VGAHQIPISKFRLKKSDHEQTAQHYGPVRLPDEPSGHGCNHRDPEQ
jgi:hypothetical protein